MRKCSKCGYKAEDKWFCPECGAAMEEIKEEPTNIAKKPEITESTKPESDGNQATQIKYDPITLTKNFILRIFDFQGVMSRKEYWLSQLIMFIVFFIVYFLVTLLISAPGIMLYDSDAATTIIGLLLTIAMFVLFAGYWLGCLSMTVRRLHDKASSGWCVLLGLIPMIGGIIVLVMCCTETVVENNKWRQRDIQKGYPVLTPEVQATYKY